MAPPRVSANGRAALLGAVLVVVAVAAVWSWRGLAEERAVAEVCELVREGRFDAAVAASEDVATAAGAECRCVALASTDRLGDCLTLLADQVTRPENADWVPPLPMTRLLLAHLRDAGELEVAAPLARRAGARHPDDGMLRYLEFTIRATADGEDAAATAMAAELRGAPSGHGDLRLLLATVFERRGDLEEAERALGEAPSDGTPEQTLAWFEARLRIAAGRGDVPTMTQVCEQLRATGASEALVVAEYAVALSTFQLADPERSLPELFEAALADEASLPDALAEFVYWRYAGQLALEGRNAEAVAVYRRGRERFELAGVSEEDLLTTGLVLEVSGGAGTVRFAVPAARLLHSPPPSAPVDAPFLEAEVRDGIATVLQPPGIHPLRWVAQDEDGRVVGSGSTRVRAAEVVEVTVAAGTPVEPRLAWSRPDRPGDGRTRVALVIWDCADWRLVRYLMARGELPVLAALLESGKRAVVRSTPAYTAAAMESLVRPAPPGGAGVLSALHELGAEIRERRSVPENPLEGLSLFFPERADTVARLGSGDRTVVSLLFSHGVFDAARQGEIVGPFGARADTLRVAAYRPLRPDEEGGLASVLSSSLEVAPQLARETASLMDASEELLASGRADALLLRLGGLDVMTHGTYREVAGGDQDDGTTALLDLYRYLDRRTGELAATLDADDYLIVASDHGVRTPLEHDERALFVIDGPGVEAGRLPGLPHWRGLPRLLAELFGEPVDWPRTGLSDAVGGAP